MILRHKALLHSRLLMQGRHLEIAGLFEKHAAQFIAQHFLHILVERRKVKDPLYVVTVLYCYY